MLGCKVRPDTRQAPSTGAVPQPSVSEPQPLRGWKGVGYSELRHTVLWASHLLVRHRESGAIDCSFIKTGWRLSPRVNRSRAEAHDLAIELARRARLEPHAFFGLAQQFSEDLTTRDRAGALGGMPASQFLAVPQVLDALATLRPGEVSDVVETECGYHVLTRHAPPAEGIVSGQHIVIGYDEAPWLRRVLARRGAAPVARSRERALELAQRVQAQARQEPQSFPDLVERYSEHEDAVAGGDLGEWSMQEATAFNREVEALAAVPIGAVTDVIDTHVGLQIALRTRLRPRRRYAMTAVKIWFDPAANPTQPSSRAAAERLARTVLTTLTAEPSRISALQKQYCCPAELQWVEGRGPAGLTALLEPLGMSQISNELAEGPSSFSIVQRLDPDHVAPEMALSFELPTPKTAEH